MGVFSIRATDLCWIDESIDNPEDYCLHGHAVAIIGNKIFLYSKRNIR